MEREYIIIGLFLLFSVFIGFLNKPRSIPELVWLILYIVYLVMSVLTTSLLLIKQFGNLKGFDSDRIEVIASNLLVIGIMVFSPWIALYTGREIKRLFLRRTAKKKH